MKRDMILFFFSAGVSRLASKEVTKPAWDFWLSSREDISDISDINNANHSERERSDCKLADKKQPGCNKNLIFMKFNKINLPALNTADGDWRVQHSLIDILRNN